MKQILQSTLAVSAALMLVNCATNDKPPCRRVTAVEFMRPHIFKGKTSDQFVGTTKKWYPGSAGKPDKAFKTIYEMGFNHSWAVIWCPVSELPQDYLRTAHERPTRRTPDASNLVQSMPRE